MHIDAMRRTYDKIKMLEGWDDEFILVGLRGADIAPHPLLRTQAIENFTNHYNYLAGKVE